MTGELPIEAIYVEVRQRLGLPDPLRPSVVHDTAAASL